MELLSPRTTLSALVSFEAFACTIIKVVLIVAFFLSKWRSALLVQPMIVKIINDPLINTLTVALWVEALAIRAPLVADVPFEAAA